MAGDQPLLVHHENRRGEAMSPWWLLLILPAVLVGMPLGIVAELVWLERVANGETAAKKKGAKR